MVLKTLQLDLKLSDLYKLWKNADKKKGNTSTIKKETLRKLLIDHSRVLRCLKDMNVSIVEPEE